eukprot:gene4172-5150_t
MGCGSSTNGPSTVKGVARLLASSADSLDKRQAERMEDAFERLVKQCESNERYAAVRTLSNVRQQKRAQQLLASVYVAVEDPSQLVRKRNSEELRAVLDVLFEAAGRCGEHGALGMRLVALQRCIVRILLGLANHTALMNQEKWQVAVGAWQEEVRQARRWWADMTRPSDCTSSAVMLDLHLTWLETVLVQLPQGLGSKGLAAGLKIAQGLCSSVVKGVPDKELWDGLKAAACVAVNASRQMLTRNCFVQLTQIGLLPPTKCQGEQLRLLQQLHFKQVKGETGLPLWKPTNGRWEPKAAYVNLVAEVIAGQQDASFRQRVCDLERPAVELLGEICLGSNESIGLVDLLMLGLDDSPAAQTVSTPLVHLVEWAQKVVQDGVTGESMGGLWNVLVGELQQVADASSAKLAAANQQLGHSLGIVGKARLQDAQVAVGSALDTLQEALWSVQAVADAAHPLVLKASRLMHTLGAKLHGESIVPQLMAVLRSKMEAVCDQEALRKQMVDNIRKAYSAMHLQAVKASQSVEWLHLVELVPLEAIQCTCTALRAAVGEMHTFLLYAQRIVEGQNTSSVSVGGVLHAALVHLAQTLDCCMHGDELVVEQKLESDKWQGLQLPQAQNALADHVAEKLLAQMKPAVDKILHAIKQEIHSFGDAPGAKVGASFSAMDEVSLHVDVCLSVVEQTAEYARDSSAGLDVWISHLRRDPGALEEGVERILAALAQNGGRPLTLSKEVQGMFKHMAAAGDSAAEALHTMPSPEEENNALGKLVRSLRALCDRVMGMRDLGEALTERFSKEVLSQHEGASWEFRGSKAEIEQAVQDMKVTATDELERLAEEAKELVMVEVVDVVQRSSTLLQPALGLLRDAVEDRRSKRASEVWRVREAAAVALLRILDVLRHEARQSWDSAGSASEIDERWQSASDAVQSSLQVAMLRSQSLEPVKRVRDLLSGGEALGEELNAPHRAAKALSDEEKAALESARQGEMRAAWLKSQRRIEHDLKKLQADAEQLQSEAEKTSDPMQKQLLLLQSHDALARLADASHSVETVGAAVGVVVGCLKLVNAKINTLGSKLEEMQEDARVLTAEMRRLVGKPVLEELREQKERRCLELCRLREVVYIPPQGVRADMEGKFVLDVKATPEHPKGTNPPVDLLKEVHKSFLKSDEVNLLLLAGPAGSGKSTFVKVLEQFLETEYAENIKCEEGAEVCLLKVSLPTLQNPLADLFGEALRQKGLREAQIHELRDLAQAGTVRLIFLLDAYDELPSQCLFKNLYMSNNLEQNWWHQRMPR